MVKSEKSIELRSEKVRNIIGQVPSALVRNGTLAICITLVILLLVTVIIPYRETVSVVVKMDTYPETHFLYSPKSGFFVSDSIRKKTNEGSIIGHIIDENAIENITSPIKGELLMNISSECFIEKGKLICVIIPSNHVLFGIVEIPIEDYCKIKEDNEMKIVLDGGETISGSIEKRSPSSYSTNNRIVMIKFRVDSLNKEQFVGKNNKGEIIIRDVSILSKLMSSFGSKTQPKGHVNRRKNIP